MVIEAYLSFQSQHGNNSITVGPTGILVSGHPFLAASPDGTIYDPSSLTEPFFEVKWPYTYRNRTPIEAASSPRFCSTVVLQSTDPSHSNIPKL